MGNSPDGMNSILESHVFTMRLEEAFHLLQVRDFARLETLGIMEHKTRILRGNDFGIDIAYSMLLM